jgi:hypothetical protein
MINDINDLQNDSSRDISQKSQFSIQEFQSYYYKFNAKPDRETKFFREDKIVSREDIIELNNSIQEKLNLNECVTTMTNITVAYNNDRTVEYSNWTVFENEQWSTSAVIRSIIITWDFTLSLKGYDIPQRHTVKFRIGTRLKPKDLMELMWNHDDEAEIHEAFAHSICTIDFINPLISSEVFLIVENWHKALPDNFFENRTQKYLSRHSTKIEYLISVILLFSGCLLIYGVSKVYLKLIWTDSFNQQFYYRVFGGILLTFLFFYTLIIIAKSWSKRSWYILTRLKPSNIFTITKGDINNIKKNKEKNKNAINEVLKNIVVTIVVAILAYFSRYIFDLILKMIKD